ncbi:hypothetical protein SAMN05216241_103222 [Limimonas halophila]|uniref:Uncharacterized protein n=1 Tax=Limimonas halophila TaxID=1082479 RepID=A0A1G7Q4C0_9PROT|nr:hypothetical protein [Limimonas halophila]SDF93318.1 hypothetical protein SAMN05216241_103222 [Limimonas halophila]
MRTRFILHDPLDAGEVQFQDVRVLSSRGDRVKVRFTTTNGETLDAVFDKEEVRGLFNWSRFV